MSDKEFDPYRAGGRSLDAIWLNAELGPNECRFLEVLARETNFTKARFTEEKSHLDKRLYSYIRLSKQGFVDVRKRLLDLGVIRYRKSGDGFTYYAITEKLFQSYRRQYEAVLADEPGLSHAEIRSRLIDRINCKSAKVRKRGQATLPKMDKSLKCEDGGQATLPEGQAARPRGQATLPEGQAARPIIPYPMIHNPLSSSESYPQAPQQQSSDPAPEALPNGKEDEDSSGGYPDYEERDIVHADWFLETIKKRHLKTSMNKNNIAANAKALASLRARFGTDRVSFVVSWLMSPRDEAKLVITGRNKLGIGGIESLTKLAQKDVFLVVEKQARKPSFREGPTRIMRV